MRLAVVVVGLRAFSVEPGGAFERNNPQPRGEAALAADTLGGAKTSRKASAAASGKRFNEERTDVHAVEIMHGGVVGPAPSISSAPVSEERENTHSVEISPNVGLAPTISSTPGKKAASLGEPTWSAGALAAVPLRAALVQLGSLATANMQIGPRTFLSLPCVLALAALAFLVKSLPEAGCCQRSLCCRKLRLWLKVDTHEEFTVAVTVREACPRLGALVGTSSVFIALLQQARGMPKLGKEKRTAAAGSQHGMRWEQTFKLTIPQGKDAVQVCAYKKALIGAPVLLGWGTVKTSSLLPGMQAKAGAPCLKCGEDMWVDINDVHSATAGAVKVCFVLVGGSRGAKKDGKGAPPQDPDVPNVFGLSTDEKLEIYAAALTGRLKYADRTGSFHLRTFRLDMRKGLWVWSWWAMTDHAESFPTGVWAGKKPLGRIPFLSIATIVELPHTISDFIVRYRNVHGDLEDMLLQRQDQPREWWVKTLRLMIDLVREVRRQTRGQSSEGPSSDERSVAGWTTNRSADSGRDTHRSAGSGRDTHRSAGSGRTRETSLERPDSRKSAHSGKERHAL